MPTNNSTVLDLNKCQHATFGYVNEYKHWRRYKPIATRCGSNVPPELVNEQNKHVLDTWIPCIDFQLTANHSIRYTGKKAIALKKAWDSKIFKNHKPPV